MHTDSLPPGDRDESAAKTYPCNTALREKLRGMRALPGARWSNSKFATRLGISNSVISQYLSDDGNKYSGDTTRLEIKIDDFLRNESRRRASGVETAQSEVAAEVNDALEYARKTNGVAEVFAESGEGKSRALELYVRDNPTALLFVVRAWSRDQASLEHAIFELLGHAGYDHHTKRADFIAQKLRDSDRLICVDDAHKLTKPALQWLFDMHEATHCPMALVGTFALEKTLNEDSQRSSRVGIYFPISSKDPRPLIAHMVNQLIPDAGSELGALCDLAEDLAAQHGHYRNVHQQLKLAVELKESRPKITWVKAFEMAATLMPNRPATKSGKS